MSMQPAELLQEEVAPTPSRLQPPLRYRGTPGFGEIKAHTYAGIREGIRDLRRHAAAAAAGDEPVLLTYVYRPRSSTLTVYALRPRASILQPGSRSPSKLPRGGRAWVDGLGTWHEVTSIAVPAHPEMKSWLQVVGPTVRGSAFEPLVRRAFIEGLRPKRHLTARKDPVATGADVRWQELAEYLYELAGELSAPR
ncbi:hypothetical protein [Georgenia sp. SYP-B2076]|uniref:hypothetical protein n=1 Tax=Georgenia sp. SYP-B2076 TaxID=2495881 RepID=UPI000F8E4E8B|nr:hypothetical protein [Georgenia sp. SYP-B2076]